MERLISRNNLLIPLAGVLAGILFVAKTSVGWGIPILLFLLAGIIYLSLIKNSKDPIKAFRLNKFHYLWLFLGFTGVGSMSALLHKPTDISSFSKEEDIYLEGYISDIQSTTNGERLIVECERIVSQNNGARWLDNVKIIVNTDNSPFDLDDRIAFKTRLNIITDSPNTFRAGYSSCLNEKNIFYTADVPGNRFVKIGRRTSIAGLSQRIRRSIEAHIENLSLTTDTKNFIISIILGDRDYMDPELRGSFADAGVAHILALSGMHTAIIGGIFLFLLFPLNFRGKYKLRIAIATLLLWVYAFISGMYPSTIRACCMISFYAMALILERKRSSFNALYGAAMIILIFSPTAINDAGFQLSCVCVFSLIAFSNALNPIDHKSSPFLYKSFALVLATCVATAGSWVLTGFYFNNFPTVFLPANLLLLPVLPIYVALSLIHIVFSAIGMEIALLGRLIDYGFKSIVDSVQLMANHSPSMNITIPLEGVVMWFVGIVILASYFNVSRKRYFLTGGLVSLAISLFFIFSYESPVPDNSLLVRNEYIDIFLSVMDKGAEKRVKFPRYKVSLIKVGEKNILVLDDECNLELLPQGIDFLIISGGFKGDPIEIVNILSPGKVIIHPSVRMNTESEIIDSLTNRGILVHSIRRNNVFRYIP